MLFKNSQINLFANQTKFVDKGSEFYGRSVKSWLQDNDMEMYSTRDEGKSLVAERFIRTLKNQICKYMASIPKNVYLDKLQLINGIYIYIIKMKVIYLIKPNTYIHFGE